MADDKTLTDSELAAVLERAVKLLRVGDEGRGTYAWYRATGEALKQAMAALIVAGVRAKDDDD